MATFGSQCNRIRGVRNTEGHDLGVHVERLDVEKGTQPQAGRLQAFRPTIAQACVTGPCVSPRKARPSSFAHRKRSLLIHICCAFMIQPLTNERRTSIPYPPRLRGTVSLGAGGATRAAAAGHTLYCCGRRACPHGPDELCGGHPAGDRGIGGGGSLVVSDWAPARRQSLAPALSHLARARLLCATHGEFFLASWREGTLDRQVCSRHQRGGAAGRGYQPLTTGPVSDL